MVEPHPFIGGLCPTGWPMSLGQFPWCVQNGQSPDCDRPPPVSGAECARSLVASLSHFWL